MNLIDAVIENDIKAVQKLLAEGADPNLILDIARITPLHFAAQNNAVAAAELLINAGADLRAKIDPEGLTPLDIAKLHENKEMIQLLERLTCLH